MTKQHILPIFSMLWIVLGTCSPLLGQTLVWAQNEEVFPGNFSIVKTELGSNKIETILNGEVPHSLCKDKATQTIFWSESGNNDIWKYSVNTDTKVKLYHSEDSLRGLIFNNGKLYFGTGVGVYKMNTDGSGIEQVVVAQGVDEVAVAEGNVFWTGAYTGHIWKQNANGIGGQLLYQAPKQVSDLQYNTTDMKLYWRVYYNDGDTLYLGLNKAQTDGSSVTNIMNDFIDAFCFDDTGTKIYCNSFGYSSIFSIDTVGGNKTNVFVSSVYDKFWNPGKISVTGGKIFWFSYYYGDYLRYGSLTSFVPKTIATKTVYRPSRIAVDTVDHWIYWVNSSGSYAGDPTVSIRRAKLDGTNMEILLSYPLLTFPNGIELDLFNQKMYWTDLVNNVKIRKANTNGTQVQNLVSGNNYDPIEVAIDVPNNRMFWTDNFYKRVMKSALDGSGISVVASNLTSPGVIAYDAIADSIYFGDWQKIRRVSPNGGGLTTVQVLTGESTYLNSICVDHANNYMYWTEPSGSVNPLTTIKRARLDGSDAVVLLDSSHHVFNAKGVRVYPSGSLVVKTHAPIVDSSLEVFPNPFRSSFNIAQSTAQDKLSLYDILGRAVSVRSAETADGMQVDASGLAPGLYTLVVKQKNGATKACKLMKAP